MKYAFISDIHGNDVALEAVLKDIEQVGCDKIFVLGDLCFRGPAPKACLDRVREVADGVLKGNADAWVVRGVRRGEVPDVNLDMMNKERDWTLTQLEQADLDFLAGLPMTLAGELGGGEWLAFHATPTDLFPAVLPAADEREAQAQLIGQRTSTWFLYGHIHLPYVRQFGKQTVINLGSVGLPFDGERAASYVVMAVGQAGVQIDLRRVPYDVSATIRRLQAQDYPNLPQVVRMLQAARP